MRLPTADDLAICVYCPKLCRHTCPVAVGSAREAAAPSKMAQPVSSFLRGDGSLSLALEAASLCVDCDACTQHCDLARPLGQLLTRFRRGLSAPQASAEALAIEGTGPVVAVESDDRRWAEALALRLKKEVARLRTSDWLGHDEQGQPVISTQRKRALQTLFGDRTAVVSDHRCQQVLTEAGIATQHLVELVDLSGPGPLHHPCHGPRLDGKTAPDALACCGATGALKRVHPDVAAAVVEDAARRLVDPEALAEASANATAQPTSTALGVRPLRSPDSGCARALCAAGTPTIDPVDVLTADVLTADVLTADVLTAPPT